MLPTRRSIRLKDFDYSSEGAYFFTICVQDRRDILGDMVDGAVRMWMEGQMVREVWDGLGDRFSTVWTDAFIVMPNHVHGIVVLGVGDGVGSPNQAVGGVASAMNLAPTAGFADGQRATGEGPTLGEVVRVFKAVSTRRIRDVGDESFGWQRNYYERVIRDERELGRARAYIEGNAMKWAEDVENPRVQG